MRNILEAARRDAAGIIKLYIHWFFRRRWYKAHNADVGTQALVRLFPWAMGVMVPWALFESMATVWAAQGPVDGIIAVVFLSFLIWAAYRVYRIIKPENQASGAGHVRGAEVADLSGEGEQR